MESAPQSTITHNAVIEFASDPDCHRRRSPRERRAHKKKANPAQQGGLKSAGPCQNHTSGATPRAVVTGFFKPSSGSFYGVFSDSGRNRPAGPTKSPPASNRQR